MNIQYPIYPSQAKAFKQTAKSFSELIAQKSNTKLLSAFKRNDYLAQALGYKGHTDLLKLIEHRRQADDNQQLMLFIKEDVRLAIINKFVQRLPDLKRKSIQEAAAVMCEREIIQSNLNPSLKLQGEGWTVESVFDESNITKYEPTSYGYDFWLKGLSTPIKVKLTHRNNSRFVDFSLSHYIKTPEQMDVYRPGNQSGDYLEYALQRAVSAITDFYQIAVNNGHEPQDSWLHENGLF